MESTVLLESRASGEPATIVSASAQRAPLVSFVVPVYNEEQTVLEVLRRLQALPLESEIVVVDDGSTDQTPILLGVWQDLHGGRVIRQENRGKGAAIRAAIPHLRGQVTVIQDADLELDPQELPALIAPVAAGEAAVVYGSRFLDGQHEGRGGLVSRLGNHGVTRLANRLYGAALTDLETCYKVLPTHVLQGLELVEDRFGFEPEVTAKLCRLGLEITELPISYQARSRAEGKKIRWRDGWEAVRVLLRVWRQSRRLAAPALVAAEAGQA